MTNSLVYTEHSWGSKQFLNSNVVPKGNCMIAVKTGSRTFYNKKPILLNSNCFVIMKLTILMCYIYVFTPLMLRETKK